MGPKVATGGRENSNFLSGSSNTGTDAPTPSVDMSIPALLLPLRKFEYSNPGTFKSYGQQQSISGSAVKQVEEVKKTITLPPVKSRLKKGQSRSKLQIFLEGGFPVNIITRFLTTRDVYTFSLSSFFFHTKVYDISEEDYSISIANLCALQTTKSAGFLDENYAVVDTRRSDRHGPCSYEQLRSLTSYFKSPSESLRFMLKEFHVEPERDVEQPLFHDFLRALAASPASDNLINLSLDSAFIGLDGMIQFCSAVEKSSTFSNLKVLNLRKNLLGYQGLHRLKMTLERSCFPNIETLVASENDAHLAVYEFFELKFAKAHPKLCNYDFSENGVSPVEPDAALMLRNLKSFADEIVSLDVSFNPLEDLGMRHLVTCLFKTDRVDALKLTSLNLQNCSIGNETVHILIELIRSDRLTSLRSLNLSMNIITGVSISELTDVFRERKFNSIRELRFSVNNIGNEAASEFAQIIYLGFVDFIEVLDVSNISANPDVMQLVGRQIASRIDHFKLHTLIVDGRQPFATRNVRSLFKADFLMKVKVS